MIYTQKVKEAIELAIKTHEIDQKQKRKGKIKDIAYVPHPLTVGLILSLAGASGDAVVAGILHDTIEDSIKTKKVTPVLIQKKFGKKVRDLVVSVSEMNKALPWAERKAEALKHIQHFSHESVMLKSADVLSNGTELAASYWKHGKEVFDGFKPAATHTLPHYEHVIAALLKRWPKNPLAGDLKKLDREFKKIGKKISR